MAAFLGMIDRITAHMRHAHKIGIPINLHCNAKV